jgi:hypothetical protein
MSHKLGGHDKLVNSTAFAGKKGELLVTSSFDAKLFVSRCVFGGGVGCRVRRCGLRAAGCGS